MKIKIKEALIIIIIISYKLLVFKIHRITRLEYNNRQKNI